MDFEQQAIWNEPVIFEKGQKGLRNNQIPNLPEELINHVNKQLERIGRIKRLTKLNLPEIGELEVLRHYTRLSQMTFGVTSGFYPLGSCTMKYNPIINDKIASSHKIGLTHPDQPVETIQGSLQIIYELQQYIAEIFGLPGVTVQPAAGAAGEYTGLLVIRAYHKKNGENKERREIIIPDSAHGTNFASAAMAGYKVVIIPSTKEGLVNLDALRAAVGPKTAGFMLTNPSTLGIFEYHIKEITTIIHEAGGLCYYDGANLNAIVAISRPGDMLFDVAHSNLHKTFSTPHGGGGPGAGVVAVREDLIPFLPKPAIIKRDGQYLLDYDRKDSIGKVKAYLGNFGVLVRAYVYIFMMGWEGLQAAASHAVLNANYMAHFVEKIKGITIPYKDVKTGLIKHEFVASAEKLKKETGISTLDVSKRLIDFNVHPPTIYFPMIVPEALMVEPTETEPKENLDRFINALENISKEAFENPEIIKNAPHNMSVGRIDDVLAARNPKLSQRMKK
ncbi:MAG: putative glycine dehydrogenase (decarboxylating) subunit 2 [Candidatus Heimdallarchaeota archaeon LC_3]|nr:MAG: putative glycine dehydrogenase (decarboxylating) subunit 2 [Candidatus Heimdallarchaeota archaeon LC_3]